MLGAVVGAGSSRPHVHLLNDGKIVDKWIREMPKKYPLIRMDNYVIMPNHVHMILFISGNIHGRDNPAPTSDIRSAIGYWKYQTTKEINIPGFWQRSYHDHIIRNETEYQRIWQYMDENPEKWTEDCYYPS